MNDRPNPFARVANAIGVPRLCATRCSSCLLNPGQLTDGMRAVVADARERESYVMCHETYSHATFEPAPGVEPAMCRGYFDAYRDDQYGLRIVAQHGLYEEVPAPPPDADDRGYELLTTDDGEFVVGRRSRDDG